MCGRPALVAVSSEGGLAAFDAANGSSYGPKLSPRSADKALSVVLLDALGGALPPSTAPLDLRWARNSTAELSAEPSSDPGKTSRTLNLRDSMLHCLPSVRSASWSARFPWC